MYSILSVYVLKSIDFCIQSGLWRGKLREYIEYSPLRLAMTNIVNTQEL